MREIDRRTFLKGVGILGGTALGLGGLSRLEAQGRSQVLRYGFAATDIRGLDPMGGPNAVDKAVLEKIFDGLVRPVPGDVNVEKIEADLAESWELSKDLKSWTFRLRRGVEFHNGFGEFTSEDVVFTQNRAKDKKTNVYYKTYANFADIKAIDKHTVQINLERPASPISLFPALLNWQAGMMMSKKAAEKLGDKIKTHPIGTGAFVFKEHLPQERLVLERNKSYFRGMPKLEQIVFRFLPDSSSRVLAFKAGELDIIDLAPEQRAIDQAEGPGIVTHGIGPLTVHKLHMVRTKKPLNDIRVRQAIAYAINRDDIVRFIGKDVAQPLYSIIPPSFVGGLEDVPERLRYNYDPQRAKKLLAEAGFPNGFTIDPVFISEREQFRRPMEVIQNQLSKVGIKINVNVIAHPAWHKKNDEGSNPLVLRAATRFPTANFVLEEFFTKGTKRNFSGFTGADDAITRAQEESNPEVQKKLWREAQIKILEDLAAYPTHAQGTYFARKSYVDLGVKLNADLCICAPIKRNARLT